MAVRPVTADELELLVHGGHGHPHAVLGPHTGDGSVTVRDLQAARQDRPGRLRRPKGQEGSTRPRVLRHLGRRAARRRRARLPRRGRLRPGRDHPRRPLPVPAHPRRDGPPPHQRGPARAAVGRARRPPAPLRGLGTAPMRAPPSRCGRRRPGACGSRATSTAGTAASTRCASSARRACGSCSCPTSATATKYKFLILGADGQWREKADPMAFHTENPPATSSVVFESSYAWGDDDWMTHRGDRPPVHGADVGLRDAPRLLEEALGRRRLLLCAARRRPGPLPRRPRLHPRGVPAGDGAPVRRVVGLPGHVVLRADRAVRRPRRLPLPRRPAAPGRHRRDRRLGARALPQGHLRARRASTAHRSTRTPTPRAGSTPTGAPTSSTSAAARSATSWSPTRSTGSRSTTSTASGSTPSPR